MRTACLALGGNLGDVASTFQWVHQELVSRPDIEALRMSRIYRTAPVGANAGNPFLNAAIVCRTPLAPEDLLEICQHLEQQAGRTREIHWGPRRLDLDLIGLEDQVVRSPRLILPHPSAWYRRFVLDPLCELAPDWWHPERQATARELRDRLQRRPLIMDLRDLPCDTSLWARELHAAFSSSELEVWTSTAAPASGVATELATWRLIDPGYASESWQAAAPLHRLATTAWTSLAVQDLVDVVRSALDVPVAE